MPPRFTAFQSVTSNRVIGCYPFVTPVGARPCRFVAVRTLPYSVNERALLRKPDIAGVA